MNNEYGPYDLVGDRLKIARAAQLQHGSFPVSAPQVQGVGGALVSAAPGAFPGLGAVYAKQSTGSVYGDIQSMQAVLVSGVDNLVLTRPGNTRAFLLIYNPNPLALYVAFDQQANANCIQVAANGGNWLMDSFVPQNDLHLFYTGANVNVQILFANVNLGP